MYQIALGALLLLTFGFAWAEPRFHVKSRKAVCFMLAVGYIALITFRPTEVKDTQNYIDIYNYVKTDVFYRPDFFGKLYGVEYGFIYLIQICKFLFGGHYRALFFLVAVFNYSASMYGIRQVAEGISGENSVRGHSIYKQKQGIGFLLFNTYIGFLYSGISMRAGITLAFSYCIMGFFIKKQYGKCGLSLALAFLFQRTVAVLAVALICYKALPAVSRKMYFAIWGLLGGMLIGQVGGRAIGGIAGLLNAVVGKLHMGGYSGYLRNFDCRVGKTDLWIWLLAGAFLLCPVRSEKYYKLVNVYLTGLLILNFVYPIRASSRVYDYFIIFFAPILVVEYYLGENQRVGGKLKKNMVLLGAALINMAVMLRLAF